MNVVIFGASGMVGQGVLLECLRDTGVERVRVIGRSSAGQQHAKLREVLVKDLFDVASYAAEMTGLDACFFCLGVSSAGMTEAAYRRLTYDLTVVIAQELAARNSALCFVYVSGAGTDSTERSRTMWARVKGATENALLRMHALPQRVHVPARHHPTARWHSLEDARLSPWLRGDGAGAASLAPCVSQLDPDDAGDWAGDACRCAQRLATACT